MLYLFLIDTESDKKDFSVLVDTYSTLLYNVAFKILHDRQLAEDAVQETLFSVAKYFDKIKQFEGKERTAYLIMMVKNAAKKMVDERNDTSKSIRSIEEETENLYTNNIEGLVDEKIEKDRILEALKEIDSDNFEYIMARLFYKVSYRELSDITGMTETNLRKRVSRAKKKLLEIMEKFYEKN